MMTKQQWMNHIREMLSSKNRCVGDGSTGSGCGMSFQRSGEVCKRCNGMILSPRAITIADNLARTWEEQDKKE